jgi:hypothetical protein
MRSQAIAVGLLLLICRASSFADAAAPVVLKDEGNHVAVTIQGQLFTDYWYGKREDRPYVRPFFSPVLAPDGTPVTIDHFGQKEHPHHSSLWVAHGDVNGADHWSLQGDKTPIQRHIRFESVAGDTIVEDLQWEGKNHEPILAERRTLRFMPLGQNARAIDFTLEFTPMAGPVTFGDTKEAGLVAVRMAKEISDHPTITTAAGVSGEGMAAEKKAWGKAADWCDISGQVSGKDYGVAVLDNPANPRHPTRWHVRAYGLLAANPFGLSFFDKGASRHAGDFPMEADKTITFRYRVIVHEGDARSADLPEKYSQYTGR